MLGGHVIGQRARRTLGGEFQHQRAERRDHQRPFGCVRWIFVDAVEVAAHRRHGLVIDVTTPLDHGRVADAEAEDEAIIIEAGQGEQAAPGSERVAGIDVGDGAADDQPGRVRQHEPGDREGFISERFRVPKRRVAEFFHLS
jgi:hypothetical protein